MNKKQITALALTTVMAGTTLSGCFGGGAPVYEFVEVIGYTEEYDVGDQFSYSGIKLKFKEQGKNNYKIIDVTEDMIKSFPDLSTSGQKEVAIEYDGVEYKFTITVNSNQPGQGGEQGGQSQVVERFLEYLQNYQKGSINKISGSYNVDLITKFLNETAPVLESNNFELNKTQLNQMGTQDQQKFLRTLYEAITDSVVKSGFNITEEKDKYNINFESIINNMNQTLINKAVQDELFYAMFPQGIDVFCLNVVSEISNVLDIKSTAVKLSLQQNIKNILIAINDGNFEEVNNKIQTIFNTLTNKNYTKYFREVERIYSIYQTLTSENPNNILSNLVSAVIDGDNLIVVDNNSEVVNTVSINNKKTSFKNTLINIAKSYERLLFGGFSNIKTELKNISTYYTTMGDIIKELRESDLYFSRYSYTIDGEEIYVSLGDDSDSYYLISAYANLYYEICALVESFTSQQDSVLIIEKLLFVEFSCLFATAYNVYNNTVSRVYDQEAPISISVENGCETTNPIIININTQNLINEYGDCVLTISGLEDLILTQAMLDNYELADLYEICIEDNGGYYIEITTTNGQLVFSSYVVKKDPLHQFLWAEKTEDTITNINNVAKYIKVLSAKDEEEMVEFISDLVDKDIYINNYNEHGTPYFITEVVKNAITNSDGYEENKQYNDQLLEKITIFTKYVDELKLKSKNGENVGSGVLNSLAEMSQGIVDLNKTHYGNNNGGQILAVLAVLKTNLQFKDKLTTLLNNLDLTIEDLIYTTFIAPMHLFNESEALEIKSLIKQNTDKLLNGSVDGFNMFEKVIEKIIVKLEIENPENYTKFSTSALNIAKAIDQYFIDGNYDALGEVIFNNYLNLFYVTNNPMFEMVIDLVGKCGYDLPSIVNGALNSADYKATVEGMMTGVVSQFISSNYGLVFSNELMETVNNYFTIPLLETLKTEEYNVANLTAENVVLKYYLLLDELDVNYNTQIKNILLEISDESEYSIAENIINVLNNGDKRKVVCEHLVDLLGINDTDGNVANFIDGIIQDAMSGEINIDEKIDELALILDNGNMWIGGLAIIEIGVKSVNAIIRDSESGNVSFETIRKVIADFKDKYKDSDKMPDQLDLILTLITYSENSQMGLVAEVLENEFAYNNCVKALTEAINAFDPNLYTFKEEVDEKFSKEVLNYIILNKNINSEVVLNIYNQTIDYINLENGYSLQNNLGVELILTLLNVNNGQNASENLKNNLANFVQRNKTEVAQGFVNMAISVISDHEVLGEAYQDATVLIENFIDIILGNKDNIDEVLINAKEFSDTYYGKETTTAIGASVAVITILTGNENIDYNKLFSFIELPQGVTVDYNTLIAKLKDETTWEDCIKITEMSYVVNENSLKDDFVSQTYNIIINLDFDVQIAKVQGDIKLSFNLEK